VEKRYDLAAAGVEALRARGRNVELLALDNVPHEEVPVYLNACEALLMTSEFEASPVTVREALACNIPVLSTAVGDVESVLEGIEGCYIIEPEADEIADKLETALRREAPFSGRDKMGAYSLQSTASKLLELYQKLSR
jgi:glycosyltransferase involved in cell wall biosynthesis